MTAFAVITLGAVLFAGVIILVSGLYMLAASPETRREWLREAGVGVCLMGIVIGAVAVRAML